MKCLCIELPPGFRYEQPSVHPVKQSYPVMLFDLLDRSSNSRLCHVKGFRCLCDIFQPVNLQKNLHMSYRHVFPPIHN